MTITIKSTTRMSKLLYKLGLKKPSVIEIIRSQYGLAIKANNKETLKDITVTLTEQDRPMLPPTIQFQKEI